MRDATRRLVWTSAGFVSLSGRGAPTARPYHYSKAAVQDRDGLVGQDADDQGDTFAVIPESDSLRRVVLAGLSRSELRLLWQTLRAAFAA